MRLKAGMYRGHISYDSCSHVVTVVLTNLFFYFIVTVVPITLIVAGITAMIIILPMLMIRLILAIIVISLVLNILYIHT